MCAEIVDLDALVGGDLTFKYDGKNLKIPGDISTKTVFEIFQAFKELSDVQADGDPDRIAEANTLINDQLLKLFKIRQPELEDLPFGIRTLPVVIQEVLKLLGVNVMDLGEDDALPPAPTSRPKATRKSSPKRKAAASRRSSGSRSS